MTIYALFMQLAIYSYIQQLYCSFIHSHTYYNRNYLARYSQPAIYLASFSFILANLITLISYMCVSLCIWLHIMCTLESTCMFVYMCACVCICACVCDACVCVQYVATCVCCVYTCDLTAVTLSHSSHSSTQLQGKSTDKVFDRNAENFIWTHSLTWPDPSFMQRHYCFSV